MLLCGSQHAPSKGLHCCNENGTPSPSNSLQVAVRSYLYQGCGAQDEGLFAGWLSKNALGEEAVQGRNGLDRLAKAHANCQHSPSDTLLSHT